MGLLRFQLENQMTFLFPTEIAKQKNYSTNFNEKRFEIFLNKDAISSLKQSINLSLRSSANSLK